MIDTKKHYFYLYRVDKDGWRDNTRLISEAHLPNTIYALRQVKSTQWFIVRRSDEVIIAQSYDCKWTYKDV